MLRTPIRVFASIAALLVIADSAVAVTAAVPAVVTVVVPASVMASLADLITNVTQAGGWIQLVMPTARLPASNSAGAGNPAGRTARVAASAGTRPASADGTLSGAFATSLSAPTPSGNGFRVTVAFN